MSGGALSAGHVFKQVVNWGILLKKALPLAEAVADLGLTLAGALGAWPSPSGKISHLRDYSGKLHFGETLDDRIRSFS